MTHDFPGAERDLAQTLFRAVNQQLAVVEHDLKILEARAVELREFLRRGDALFGTPVVDDGLQPSPLPPLSMPELVPAPPALVPAPPALPPAPKTAAQYARAALQAMGQVSHVEDVYAQITAGSNGAFVPTKDAVQKALRDHPALFRRAGHGEYGLTEWGKTGVATQ
jgi:hypothetical protein